MNTNQKPEYLFFEHDEVDPQANLPDSDEPESVTFWCSPEDLCQLCFQQEGYHCAEIDRQLFVCDDCYNLYFSIDQPSSPVARAVSFYSDGM